MFELRKWMDALVQICHMPLQTLSTWNEDAPFEASEWWHQALTQAPQNPVLWNNLGSWAQEADPHPKKMASSIYHLSIVTLVD